MVVWVLTINTWQLQVEVCFLLKVYHIHVIVKSEKLQTEPSEVRDCGSKSNQWSLRSKCARSYLTFPSSHGNWNEKLVSSVVWCSTAIRCEPTAHLLWSISLTPTCLTFWHWCWPCPQSVVRVQRILGRRRFIHLVLLWRPGPNIGKAGLFPVHSTEVSQKHFVPTTMQTLCKWAPCTSAGFLDFSVTISR